MMEVENVYDEDFPMVITDNHGNLVWVSRKEIEDIDLFNNFILQLIKTREEIINEED